MSDNHTSEQRHRNMAAIRGKDTRPEMIVRRWLWGHGFRYRLNDRRLPGKPDIVLRKYRTCIFINGCFWHGHNVVFTTVNSQQSTVNGKVTTPNSSLLTPNCEQNLPSSPCCKIPRTNREFWVRKIMRNQERDLEVQHKLARMGWHSMTIWECELKPSKKNKTLESLEYTLNSIFLLDHRISYTIPEEDGLKAAEDYNYNI